jgi:hypothetical protein
VVVRDAAGGRIKHATRPATIGDLSAWEFVAVADFTGHGGDRDVLLQGSCYDTSWTGQFLSAWRFDDLVAGGPPLWQRQDFAACCHSPARLADLDGDGRDEVFAAHVLGPDGRLLASARPFNGHTDSVFVLPTAGQAEVVLLEEGDNHVQVYGPGGVRWRRHHRRIEPQNAAVGRFGDPSASADSPDSPDSPGSPEPPASAGSAGSAASGVASSPWQVWCRSRFNTDQRPFVFDADGRLIAAYRLDDHTPPGWTEEGIETIFTIDWLGGDRQHLAAKERHRRGDVAIIDALSGRFIEHLVESADRLYVYALTEPRREQVIVLAGDHLRAYGCDARPPAATVAPLRADRDYRRRRQCHNYYTP